MSAPERNRRRYLLAPEKRHAAERRSDNRTFDEVVASTTAAEVRTTKQRHDAEIEKAKQVQANTRSAIQSTRDVIRALEDLEHADRAGYLAEGAARLGTVADDLTRHLTRLNRALTSVIGFAPAEVADRPPVARFDVGVGMSGNQALRTRYDDDHQPSFAIGVGLRSYVSEVARREAHVGLDALAASGLLAHSDIPKPGEHLKNSSAGKPVEPSDHPDARTPHAASDGSGPGGGG